MRANYAKFIHSIGIRAAVNAFLTNDDSRVAATVADGL